MSGRNQDGRERSKEDAAALGFMGFLALAAGWAGVVVAALAVGLDRARRGGGGRSPRDRAAERRDRDGEHRAWLDRDAAQRAAWRQQRRDWWAAGANPADEPKGPSMAARAGRWLRRTWARTAVRISDFRTGWRDGFEAANAARRAGLSPGRVARTRPAPKLDTDGQNLGGGNHPDGRRARAEETSVAAHDAGDDEWAHRLPVGPVPYYCPRCQARIDLPAIYCQKCNARLALCGEGLHVVRRNADGTWQSCSECAASTQQSAETSTQPTSAGIPQPVGGTTMTAPTTTATAVAGESNATVMAQHLERVRARTGRVADLADQFAAERAQLEQEVREAEEFAQSTGQTAATKEALDASTAVVAFIGQQVGALSDAATEAVDQTDAAREGLRPVEHAEDALTAAGADGRSVAPATAA